MTCVHHSNRVSITRPSDAITRDLFIMVKGTNQNFVLTRRIEWKCCQQVKSHYRPVCLYSSSPSYWPPTNNLRLCDVDRTLPSDDKTTLDRDNFVPSRLCRSDNHHKSYHLPATVCQLAWPTMMFLHVSCATWPCSTLDLQFYVLCAHTLLTSQHLTEIFTIPESFVSVWQR